MDEEKMTLNEMQSKTQAFFGEMLCAIPDDATGVTFLVMLREMLNSAINHYQEHSGVSDEIIEELAQMKDLNKSLFMHIDNHNAKHVDKAIQNVAQSISNDLQELDKQIKAFSNDG